MLLKEHFPGGRFSSPATEHEIVQAEREIGVRLPDQLRQLYLECNGFREPLGQAQYLLSLTEEDGIGSLVRTTAFWRHEFPAIYPSCPDFSRFIFFGSSSADEAWAIDQDGTSVIAYHHWMAEEFEVKGQDIAQVFLDDFEQYEAS
jgi:SMI1 / KNR4 family (SUKH-1)